MTENTVRLPLFFVGFADYRCGAVAFDVETAGPGRNIHEILGRRITSVP